MKRLLYALAGVVVCLQPAAAGSLVAGKALYAVCAGCHGLQGEGNQAIGSPRLTALEDWYLTRQLSYFRQGIRGGEAADVAAQRMAPFSFALPDQRAVEDVVSYIESLPDAPPQPTLSGDAARGRQIYAACAACHGQDGRGIEQLSSPALAGLDDWYIAAQLELYRAGLRGSHREDTYGQQMRAIVGILQDDRQLTDLAVYIRSLPP